MNSQDNPIFVSHLTKWDVFKCSSLAAFFNLFFPNFHKLRLIHCFAYIKPRNKEIKHGLKSIKRMYKLNLKIG